MPGNQNALLDDDMADWMGSNRYRPFESWQHSTSKYSVYKEETKSAFKKAIGNLDDLPNSDSSKRNAICSKRKAQGEDLLPCSMIRPPSLKKMAMCRNTIVPFHVSESLISRSLEASRSPFLDSRTTLLEVGLSAQDLNCCEDRRLQTCLEICFFHNRTDVNSCFAKHVDYVNLLNQCFCPREEPLSIARKQPSSFEGNLQVFLQFLCINLIPYSYALYSSVNVATTSCKAAVQSFMDYDSIESEGKEEEVDKDKEGVDRMSGEKKDSKQNNTRSTKERKGEDKGEAGKENEEDEGKEIGEQRDRKNGEGEDEGKDDEEREKEVEGMEEEEDEEEEKEDEDEKEEDDTEVNSALCTMSIPPVEQICDPGALSDCRSQQSDDMYHGHEEISSGHVGGHCSHSNAAHSKPSTPTRVSVNPIGQVDRGASAFSHLPVSAGSVSHCMQHQRSCLQSIHVDASGQCSPDMLRDMYTDGLHCSMQQTSSHGSPCLHPVTDVAGRQTYSDVSKDMYTDGSASHNWQQTPQASPALYPPASGTVQQTSSDASRDCLSPNTVTQPGIKLRIKLPKEEITNAEIASTAEDGSGEEVLSNLKDVKASTAKALLASGLLDGSRVHYHYKGSGNTLTGVIQDGGILCDCRLCKGKVVVNVSSFEKHAGSNARHPSDYIFLENGKSLQDYIKAGSQSSQARVAGVRKAAKEENSEKSSLRSGSARTVSAQLKRSSYPSQESSKPDSISFRSSQKLQVPQRLQASQKLQASQTRDGSRHKLLFQPGGLADGTEVAYYVKGQCFLRGAKKGHGICCGCCNEVISCSQFEAHAGWASRRNAYISMYLSNGQSLHEFALALAAKDQHMTDSNTIKENDDFCAECGDGGDLVLCDACPKAYHAECVKLSRIPEGDWRCPVCENQGQQLWKKSTKESGRGHSLSNKEKNAQRCQRVVKASGNTIGGCVFCKNGDFLKSVFGPKTIMLCDQCEREYHVGCMKEKGIADLQELPEGAWFCCGDCNHIHNVLEGLVSSGPEHVQNQVCGSLLGESQKGVSSEITWQLLHGRRGNPQNGRILSEAASIFTESFDPIVDATSGRDLISLMVHSRSIRDQDFQGMYCAVLKRKEEVVSAAVLRVFGQQFAEMPLVATASASRGQGYFQMLMACIEGLLHVLQVKFLILPAAEGAEGIWTNKFGFSKLHDGQLQQFGSEVQIMIFQGSSMLIKSIL